MHRVWIVASPREVRTPWARAGAWPGAGPTRPEAEAPAPASQPAGGG